MFNRPAWLFILPRKVLSRKSPDRAILQCFYGQHYRVNFRIRESCFFPPYFVFTAQKQGMAARVLWFTNHILSYYIKRRLVILPRRGRGERFCSIPFSPSEYDIFDFFSLQHPKCFFHKLIREQPLRIFPTPQRCRVSFSPSGKNAKPPKDKQMQRVKSIKKVLPSPTPLAGVTEN